MKIILKFKTPDALDQVDEQIDDEQERDDIKEKLSVWVNYMDYITVEYDTKNDSIKVVGA